MKHPERVEDYLGHITEAIERATSYVQALPDYEAFRRDQQAQGAVVRNIEMIGEAATKINSVAPQLIAQHPELPWTEMRRMRNLVIHRYFYVDIGIVWKTATEDLPTLKQQIDQLLTEQQPDSKAAKHAARAQMRAGIEQSIRSQSVPRQPDRDRDRD